jgi:hypothetical protein
MNLRKIIVLFLFVLTINLSAQEIKTVKIIGAPFLFKLNTKYKILQYRANIRNEPGRNSRIIAVLNLNDEIEILEFTDDEEIIEEEINGIYGFWLKIKYGNIIGYTFSGNIAMGSLVTRLAIPDENNIWGLKGEVDVSLHFRMTRYYQDRILSGWRYDDNMENTLFIYINNKRINTDNVNRIPGPLDTIEFECGRYSLLIYLIAYAREGTRKYTYRLSYNGVIDYIGEYGDWYPDWYIRD